MNRVELSTTRRRCCCGYGATPSTPRLLLFRRPVLFFFVLFCFFLFFLFEFYSVAFISIRLTDPANIQLIQFQFVITFHVHIWNDWNRVELQKSAASFPRRSSRCRLLIGRIASAWILKSSNEFEQLILTKGIGWKWRAQPVAVSKSLQLLSINRWIGLVIECPVD